MFQLPQLLNDGPVLAWRGGKVIEAVAARAHGLIVLAHELQQLLVALGILERRGYIEHALLEAGPYVVPNGFLTRELVDGGLHLVAEFLVRFGPARKADDAELRRQQVAELQVV